MSLRVDYMPRTRELYAPLPPYRWVDNRTLPVPWTPLSKPLSACRVALGSSGGIYAETQEPFHFKDDTSIRTIPSDTPSADLRVAHFGYPIDYARADPNCVFPNDRMRELAAEGISGELAPSTVTFMGGIYSSRRVTEDLAPRLTARFLEDGVDAVLLVPV